MAESKDVTQFVSNHRTRANLRHVDRLIDDHVEFNEATVNRRTHDRDVEPAPPGDRGCAARNHVARVVEANLVPVVVVVPAETDRAVFGVIEAGCGIHRVPHRSGVADVAAEVLGAEVGRSIELVGANGERQVLLEPVGWSSPAIRLDATVVAVGEVADALRANDAELCQLVGTRTTAIGLGPRTG